MSIASKPIFLWCIPRSASTAFERIFTQLKGVRTVHEPFSHAYYHGPERMSARFQDQRPQPDRTYDQITAEVLAAGNGARVFVKDMAYYFDGRGVDDLLRAVKSTFLIRHPAAALSSSYRIWPDFTLQETGYFALKRVFERVSELTGETPLLIDAEDFCAKPERYLEFYCREVGLEFNRSSLAWEAGHVPEFEAWEEWHERVQETTGIEPLPSPPACDAAMPSYVRDMVGKVMPVYEELCDKKLEL